MLCTPYWHVEFGCTLQQDHAYLHRCVERFRHAARASGRKLFLACCVVDSSESLESLRSASPAKLEQDPPKLGDRSTYAHFAAAEIEKLQDALLDFGASDFKVVGVVLCIGSASRASDKTEVVTVPLHLPHNFQQGTASSEMHEVHLPIAGGADADPLKFFEDPAKNEVFTRTVLGRAEVCCEKDFVQLDDYVPHGYRDGVTEPTKANKGVQCRWCNDRFESRNKLFTHLRSSAVCVQRMSEVDSMGFSSISHLASHTTQCHAFLLGSATDAAPLIQGFREALASLCELAEIENLGAGLSCPGVGRVLLATCDTALSGDALRAQLQAKLEDMTSTVLHAVVQLKKPQLVDLNGDAAQRHFAYLLDMDAVMGTQAGQSRDFDELRSTFKHLKTAVQGIKLALTTQHASTAKVEEMKMVQRLSLQGKTYVVVRISGDQSLTESACCTYMAASVAAFHGWLHSFSEDANSCLPGLPRGCLYLEGYRFMRNEQRHGPVFGRSCLPWTSDNACGIAEYRAKLQERLANCSSIDWRQVLLHLRAASLACQNLTEKLRSCHAVVLVQA